MSHTLIAIRPADGLHTVEAQINYVETGITDSIWFRRGRTPRSTIPAPGPTPRPESIDIRCVAFFS